MNVGVHSARSEDGPAPHEDAAYGVAIEGDDVALHQALPAVLDADDLCIVLLDGTHCDASDHRVETGAVAPGGEYSNDRHSQTPG